MLDYEMIKNKDGFIICLGQTEKTKALIFDTLQKMQDAGLSMKEAARFASGLKACVEASNAEGENNTLFSPSAACS